MKSALKKTIGGLAIASVSLALSWSVSAGVRTIVKVQDVNVEATVGNVPSLPYQLLVTYSDGSSEYRLVRWSNAGRATEEMEASSSNPSGSEYNVKGYITGDNTTANGYPVSAKVRVTDKAPVLPSNVPVAEPLPLGKVTITGDNRLTSNRELDINEIVKWPVEQQLYNFRDTYGMSTEGYPESFGWDSPTTKLKGHGSGHYMSALAFAYASCQDKEKKAIIYKNICRMVNELREMQERTFVWNDELGRYWEARDYAPEAELEKMGGTWKEFDNYKKDYAKYGYGYLNAIPAAHCALIEKYAPYNNEQGVWAPYYTVHKILAGLIDISNNVDDKEISAKALLIAKDMGLWVWNRLHYRTYVKQDGTQAERRAKPGNRYEMWNMYIAGEVGGMAESLSRLSSMVSDSQEKARLIEAANYFDSPAFFDPLSQNIDDIRTRHANQHIPMIVGALRSYRENANPYYYNIASNFWNFIQGRYRYAMGGVGIGEMFREPYAQMTTMATAAYTDRRSGKMYPMTDMNETCCAYNLAKLSKDLNAFNPDDARYMDYYERVLYNQLVGSVHAHEYATTYQYSVGLNSSKPWGNQTPQESCCGGTGAENHVKYQEAAYFVNDNTMWVALYLPTVAEWDAKGVTIEQSCLWPAEKSSIKVVKGSANFALKLRVPYWATEGFDVKLNGKSVASEYQPCSYVEIPERKWSASDVVEVVMPFTKHIDFGPDKMDTEISEKNGKQSVEPMWLGTFMYGPLVMATTGIEEWKDATLSLQSDLSEISLEGASKNSGTDGNLYKLAVAGHNFIPDYYADENATRYFRINLLGDPSAPNKAVLRSAIQKAKALPQSNYTAQSYKSLSAALVAAESLYNDAAVDKAQADQASKSVNDAINALKHSGKLDKSALSSAISMAGKVNYAAYTDESVEALKAAVKASQTVLDSSESQLAVDLKAYELNTAIAELVDAAGVDKSELEEQMQIARRRRDAQNSWLEQKVKVPNYSPWAPHAYARMMEKYEIANQILTGSVKNYSQAEVDKMASSLKELINNMRPGNLPEIEDLAELNLLIAKAKEASSKSKDLKDAVAYAEMVVSYVTDGSGTSDMIDRAVKQLKDLKL